MDTIIWLIGFGIWVIILLVNMWSNHKNEQSNDELMKEIHKSNELNKKMIDAVQEYCASTSKQATAQDNLIWESVLILAYRIHDLEDNNCVK